MAASTAQNAWPGHVQQATSFAIYPRPTYPVHGTRTWNHAAAGFVYGHAPFAAELLFDPPPAQPVPVGLPTTVGNGAVDLLALIGPNDTAANGLNYNRWCEFFSLTSSAQHDGKNVILSLNDGIPRLYPNAPAVVGGPQQPPGRVVVGQCDHVWAVAKYSVRLPRPNLRLGPQTQLTVRLCCDSFAVTALPVLEQ